MIMKIWYQPTTWLPQLEIISEEKKKKQEQKAKEQKAQALCHEKPKNFRSM